MPFHRGATLRILPLLALVFAALTLAAQSGNAGAVRGTVTDPSGAVIPNATVHLTNSVSGFDRTTTTDATGQFTFANVPFNPYNDRRLGQRLRSLQPEMSRFAPWWEPTSTWFCRLPAPRKPSPWNPRARMVEDTSTYHTDVDRDCSPRCRSKASLQASARWSPRPPPAFRPTPTASFTASATTPPTPSPSTASPSPTSRARSSPTSFPPTRFNPSKSSAARLRPNTATKPASSSLPLRAAARASPNPPAASTVPTAPSVRPPAASISPTAARNGATLLRPTASIPAAFSIRPSSPSSTTRATRRTSSTASITASPHADSVHLDLNYSRSWFQTPNSYDNLNVQNVVGGGTSANPIFGNVGNADQRSKIGTYNISPTYTRIISNDSVFNLGAFVRRDGYDYYPSGNPLADLGPSNLQTSSISQYRTLTNTGVHADYSYVKGVNNLKIGAQYEQTFLRENDDLGVVESTYNSPCVSSVDRQPAARLLQSRSPALARRVPERRAIFPCSRPTISPAAAPNTTTSATPT